MSEFEIKDSGERKEFSTGMVRDMTTDKLNPSLVKDGPMYQRWVVHLTNGAKKYAARNWLLARTQEELDRYRESAQRHFDQWFDGETDEDHAAAVFFNINGAEYVKERLADQARLTIEPSLDSEMRFTPQVTSLSQLLGMWDAGIPLSGAEYALVKDILQAREKNHDDPTIQGR